VLAYGKKIAENFNRLSRVHQRYYDRRQTDGRPIAYSERERKFTSAKNWSDEWLLSLNKDKCKIVSYYL